MTFSGGCGGSPEIVAGRAGPMAFLPGSPRRHDQVGAQGAASRHVATRIGVGALGG
jgi:hypothetical protein